MRPHRALVVALCAALALAACGDDDPEESSATGLTEEEQAYADAWAASLSDDDDGFSASATEAACMGDAIMAELGVARFEEAEVAPEDITADGEADSPGELLGAGTISEEEANAILDTWEGCADLPALFAASLVDDFDLDDEASACVEEELADGELVRAGFVVSFTSDDDEAPPELVTGLIGAIDACSGSEGGEGGLIVDEIAASIAEDGDLTDEQAQCVAQAMVDVIGLDRLIELGGEDIDLDEADPSVQQEVTAAVLEAAGSCDVPLSELGG
jgi:hypothetical protein